MSEFQQDDITTTNTSKRSKARTDSTHGQAYRVGNQIIRFDSAVSRAPLSPHIEIQQGPDSSIDTNSLVSQSIETSSLQAGGVETQPKIPTEWLDLCNSIDETTSQSGGATKTTSPAPTFPGFGLGDVVANDAALQQAAREMQELFTPVDTSVGEEAGTQPTSGTLKIKPAWEVDYFRWPRLSRRLLKTHQSLFDQIGGKVLSDLQPTQSRIGVCSTFAREGKTTIATCLARWAAQNGKRTLLIDADIERPRMTVMCGLDCTFGWQSILDADIPMSETMIRSLESGLVFMPSRSGTVPVITDKSIDRLSQVTFQMKYEFDVVVIDMGTIDNICAHGSKRMDVVDAMLVARDPSRTSVGQMMDTRKVLANLGIPRTYVAQNFARQDVA